MILRFLLIYLLLILNAGSVLSQKGDTTRIGEVKGILYDSVYNYRLKSASIAIYTVKDSQLLDYQLSNNLGAFNFARLPINDALMLVMSHVGYQTKSLNFSIHGNKTAVDLQRLNLKIKSETELLPEVVVKYVPPVRLNGDTLEFNADAFRLDKNAVVEDLLKRLPGVTVWGDGSITVNGREVSGVKVDNKPFFTNDPKIALQNLPKEAVDKVQVYQKSKNSSNPMDSLTEINIKLKKEKNNGFFGKLGLGSNFSKQYETDFTLNVFNPRSQLGIVGGMNNINKIPRDVNTLMRNNTFKGVSNTLEYRPDFELAGKNVTKSAGVVLQHDFIKHPDNNNNNRLNSQYFFQEKLTDLNEIGNTTRTIGKGDFQMQIDTSEERLLISSQNQNSHYNLKTKNVSLNIFGDFSHSRTDKKINRISIFQNSVDEPISRNLYSSSGKQISSSGSLSVGLEKSIWKKYSRRPHDFRLDYKLNFENTVRDDVKFSRFVNLLEAYGDRIFDRKYENEAGRLRHEINVSVADLSAMLFGPKKSFLPRITFFNNLKVLNTNQDNQVFNRDSVQGYLSDNYLTNKADYFEIIERPGLALVKTYTKGLSNRYLKNFYLSANLPLEIFYQENASIKDFQTFNREHINFVPSGALKYDNFQYGQFRNILSLDYSRSVGYPTVDQLVPLVDSINLNFMFLGNPNLKPFKRNTFSLNFTHQTLSKNEFSYGLSVRFGQIGNVISDSQYTDNLGRTRRYLVNANGYNNLNFSGNAKKAIKLKHDQLQISASMNLSFTNSPNYVNGMSNISSITTKNANLNVFYVVRDNASFELKYDFFKYSNSQKLFQELYSNFSSNASFAGSVNITKKVRLCSDGQYVYTKNSFLEAVEYTIVNSHIIIRALSGNNLEFKLSALDLLKQNRVIKNFRYNNEISQVRSNSMQQYYMLTIAYYPRKFGKNLKKE